MKKSIAFLLVSLAATSSLLFHTQEAKAKSTICRSTIPIDFVLDEFNEFSRIRVQSLNSGRLGELQRGGLTFDNKKAANKLFKKICKIGYK